MSKIVLVTGGNKGLGLAILQLAGLREPSTTFILCSRDLEAGNAAKTQLERDGVKAAIDVLQVDVTNDDHIMAAVQHVTEKYGKLDVLVNNAGVLSRITDYSLPTLRRCTLEMCHVNAVSLAVVSTGFADLLRKAKRPRVVNLTSGLGSIENTLTRPGNRYPPYGISKVAVNGVTAHLQAMEWDRMAKAGLDRATTKPDGYINYYSAAPGLLKTALTNFHAAGADPKVGAEVVVELIADDEGKYEGGSHLEFKDGKMLPIPW
ncbi:short chain dehydrogenase/reductase family protein [Xylariomycetidae sp. FL2044]|nr:short chain dehydrogenase/reductase family protein [Xylariomycetidae sp. FL2044]